MNTKAFLFAGMSLLSLGGCAHTAVESRHDATARASARTDDPAARSLGLLQAAAVAKAAGDRPTATQLYTEAVNLQPANGQAWFGLGTNYLHQNDVELAVAALQEAVRIDPSLQKAWSNLALAHLQLFRIAARNALSGGQLTQANRDALSSLLADVNRTLGASATPTSGEH